MAIVIANLNALVYTAQAASIAEDHAPPPLHYQQLVYGLADFGDLPSSNFNHSLPKRAITSDPDGEIWQPTNLQPATSYAAKVIVTDQNGVVLEESAIIVWNTVADGDFPVVVAPDGTYYCGDDISGEDAIFVPRPRVPNNLGAGYYYPLYRATA